MDTLYNGHNQKIYQTFSVIHQNATSVEYSHSGSANPTQIAFSKMVQESSAIASLEHVEFDVRNFCHPQLTYCSSCSQRCSHFPIRQYPTVSDPPKFLSAMQASKWRPNTMGVDARPRIFDKIAKRHILIDSGAVTTIIPPEAHDSVDNSMYLQTVSGQRLQCYGRRTVHFRFGRKTYAFNAVIANVKDIILGWDFMTKYKIDLRWDDFGDIHFYDRVSKSSTILEYITVPHNSVPRTKRADITEESMTHQTDEIFFQVNAIKSLNTEEIIATHSSEYQELLHKYKGVLTPNFNEEVTKHGIEHRIITNNKSPPCRAKLRPLLPGSPKAVKGEKAWSREGSF